MDLVRQNSSPDEEIELNSTPNCRPSLPIFRRLTSTDSSVSSTALSVFEINASSPGKNSINNIEFALKIAQLVIAIVCAGLYSNGKRLMQYSIESLLLPNVVFSAFIIITGVITLGYILGNVMPPVLIRIFNIIGMTLYFVSACVTTVDWYKYARYTIQSEDVTSANMLISQACLSFINTILYGYDIYLSIKKAVTV